MSSAIAGLDTMRNSQAWVRKTAASLRRFRRAAGLGVRSGAARGPIAGLREPKQLGPIRYTPETIERILIGLQARGVEARPYTIDVAAYRAYAAAADYDRRYPSYYRSNIREKSLEHFIAADLLRLQPDDVYIDIASEGSPAPEIYRRLYHCTTYRQDLAYPPGLGVDSIGGDAAKLPVPDGFASKMGLHCSFEHFEGDADVRFIREVRRVLRPGGAVCIVPLYLFDVYAVQTDPAVAVAAGVQFEPDAVLYCDLNWGNRHGRFYDPAHLVERVQRQLVDLRLTVYRITNAKGVDPSCYVEFAAFITCSRESDSN